MKYFSGIDRDIKFREKVVENVNSAQRAILESDRLNIGKLLLTRDVDISWVYDDDAKSYLFCRYYWSDPAVFYFHFVYGGKIFSYTCDSFDVDDLEVNLRRYRPFSTNKPPIINEKFLEAANVLAQDSKDFWGFPDKVNIE